jgi:hypothetical protein
VSSGTASLSEPITIGSLALAGGQISSTLLALQANTLTWTGGTLAGSGTTIVSAPNLTTIGSAADVALSGGGTFVKINTLADNQGTFTLTSSRTFSTVGAMANSGNLEVDATSLFTSTGALTWSAGTMGGAGNVIAAGGASVTGNVVKPGTGVFRAIGGFTLSPGKRLDLTQGKMIIDAGDAGTWAGSLYTGITGLIAAGRNGNALPLWDGNGINTTQTNATAGNYHSIGTAKASDARPNTATATVLWAGLTITGTDVLVMYTYGGDATLDGKINIDDYVKIDSGIAGGYTGWVNGDFNYDGKVSIDDYITVIDVNIGNQNGFVFPATGGVQSVEMGVAIPEPMSVGMASAGLVWSMMRRRRHQGAHSRRLISFTST